MPFCQFYRAFSYFSTKISVFYVHPANKTSVKTVYLNAISRATICHNNIPVVLFSKVFFSSLPLDSYLYLKLFRAGSMAVQLCSFISGQAYSNVSNWVKSRHSRAQQQGAVGWATEREGNSDRENKRPKIVRNESTRVTNVIKWREHHFSSSNSSRSTYYYLAAEVLRWV